MINESDERIIRRGFRADYHWLTATGDTHTGTLLTVCPEAVSGRYIAVTSYDSGFRRLTDEDTAAGWVSENTIAYSPRLVSAAMLAFQRDGLDSPGHDEWYVFPDLRKLSPVFAGNYFDFDPDDGRTYVFVNIFAFALHDPNPYMPGILDRFWKQLMSIAPETYIADGAECLTIVSRSETLIQTISDRLAALPR